MINDDASSEMSPVAKAQLALMDVARVSREAEHQRRPELVALAKEMCRDAGHDPNDVVIGHAGQAPMLGAKGVVSMCNSPVQPQWCLYLNEAFTAWNFFREHKDLFLALDAKAAP